MKLDNKDVIQSYIMTTAKYDFNVYEKRIIYRLIEMVQHTLEGKKLNSGFSIERNLYDDRIITMPTSAFLAGENDENYTRVKEALRRLRNKTFEYQNGRQWKLIGIIEKPNFDISGIVKFELQPEVYEAILDFSKGYRKYELKTAMQFESIYAMRFYEIISGQKQPLTYTIEYLKEMFGLTDKYKRTNDFFKRVVDVAKKELDKCSPYTFNYEVNKLGRSFHSITFQPIYQPQHRDSELEKKDLQKQTSPSWDLPRNVIDYLKHNFDFTTMEIKQNIDLFRSANQILELVGFMAKVKERARMAKNPKGYLINSLKKELN